MNKRKRLGQHFLNSGALAQAVVDAARITKNDTVYEVGTGLGALTELLCRRAGHVISIEADKGLYGRAASTLSHLGNLTLLHGDGFGHKAEFDVFVSCLPYSESRHAVEWLAQADFARGAVLVQREFGQKLLHTGGSKRKAVGVVARHCFEMERIAYVGRESFDPPPRVDSVLLGIRKRAMLDGDAIRAVNRIFSYRKKTLRNIMGQFGIQTVIAGRLGDLSDEEIIGLAKQIARR